MYMRGFVSAKCECECFLRSVLGWLRGEAFGVGGRGDLSGPTVVAQPSFGPVPQTHFNQEIFVTKKKKIKKFFFFI